MGHSTVIVSGADATFFPLLRQAIQSLLGAGLGEEAQIGVLDQGLSPEQVRWLSGLGCRVVQAQWDIDVPLTQRTRAQVGLVARTALRDYFPGFEVYVWFDADAWVQTREFFELMVAGAQRHGAALVRENGYGYRRHALYSRWWYGHMMVQCGPWRGLTIARKPSINIGVMALAATAPHWGRWREQYVQFIARSGKLNLDQHAFNAAVHLHDLPHALLPARCNWIPRLSVPAWSARTQRLHEPGGEALSVIHLAGSDKGRRYALASTDGARVQTPLSYDALQRLRDGVPTPALATREAGWRRQGKVA